MAHQPVHATLSGQIALVTGANRGIGAQIAADLAALGATVIAGARDPTTLAGVRGESDGQIVPVKLDVTSNEDRRAAISQAGKLGGLDILVNNAGIGDWHGSTLANLEESRLRKVLETNLFGATLMAQAALEQLLRGPGGRVVNMSSGMGALEEGMSGSAPAYRISKTALNGLTAYLHGEYNPLGLIANSVCPGWVATDMGGSNAPRPVTKGAETPVYLATLKPGATSGRFWRDKQVIDF